MAYTAGNLVNLTGMPPGRGLYRYDGEDVVDVVEDAGYFNNLDDTLLLAIGDIIMATTWDGTPFASGQLVTEGKIFVVTNVIANDASAAAGQVNIAEIFQGSGQISSGA